MNRSDRLLVLAFALANGVLYSSLLPLWEGFDEPFHYGYVQYLAASHKLPVIGKIALSAEVLASFSACPVSHVVQQGRPELQTFDRYFALSAETRLSERVRLDTIPRNRTDPSTQPNYEAHQAPLAYVLMAMPDMALSQLTITTRILWLRIFAASASILLTFLAASRLFRVLELRAPFQFLGLFCIFACQMYWATVAHVANDWLAIPLSVWFYAASLDFIDRPGPATTILLALATSFGLLAKAYFLPLAVFVVCVIAIRLSRQLPLFIALVIVLAGPWYARNLVLYHDLSATVESVSGLGPPQVIASLGRVPWGNSVPYMLRAALWSGNNSFTSFSSTTLNCVLALLAVGITMFILSAIRRGTLGASEGTVLLGMAVFVGAIAYATGSEYLFRRGEAAGASPWYLEVLLAPTLAIAFLGMDRTPRFGKPVAVATALLWTYIFLCTYVVKLIPLYGGYNRGRNTLKEQLEWYLAHSGELTSMLSTISMAPPVVLYIETALVSGLAVAIAARLVLRLLAVDSDPRGT